MFVTTPTMVVQGSESAPILRQAPTGFVRREVHPRHRLVDDRHGRRPDAVAVGKRPTPDEPDAERVEVAGGHGILLRAFPQTRKLASRRRHGRSPGQAEGQPHRDGARGDAREPARPRGELVEQASCVRVAQARAVLTDLRHEQMVRVDADIQRTDVAETANEEPRAREQHDRERRLHHEQRRSRSRALHGSFACAGLERSGQLRSARLERRHQRRENAGEQSDDRGEREHAKIDGTSRPRPFAEQPAADGARADFRDDERAGRAEHREQQPLGQQLHHEAPTPDAERQAHRNLATPAQRAHEQQVRDVRARDQQHDDRDGREQLADSHLVRRRGDPEARERFARHDRSEVHDLGVDAGTNARRRIRRRRQTPALVDRRRLRGGALGADARLESGDDEEPLRRARCRPVRAAIEPQSVGGRDRKPDVDFAQLRAAESLRRDTDDRVLRRPELERLSDRAPLAGEMPLPEAVADHGELLGVVLPFFVGQEEPADGRTNAKRREVARADERAGDLRRRHAASERVVDRAG